MPGRFFECGHAAVGREQVELRVVGGELGVVLVRVVVVVDDLRHVRRQAGCVTVERRQQQVFVIGQFLVDHHRVAKTEQRHQIARAKLFADRLLRALLGAQLFRRTH